jgi:tetratricopeptide (TPR) repeat protein
MITSIEAKMDIRKFASFRKLVPAVIAAAVLCAPVFADDISDVSALLRAKQYATALAKTDAHLADRPDDSQMRFLRGLALTGMGRREEAISHFTKLSSDDPTMPEPYNNLAVLYAAGGEYDKARVALESAVRVNPAYALAHENLANMYVQLAIQSYAAMLKLEPDNADVRAKQALLLSAIDRRDEPAAADATAVPNQKAQVVTAIQKWAKAWSARDVAAYLDFYSPDFHTPHNMPRADWEAERRTRLKKNSFINVAVGVPEVSIEGTTATATFYQRYRSKHFSSSDRKTLIWEKRGEKWKIVREDTSK